MRRLVAATVAALALWLWPAPAGSHPLGNFTINVYTGIRVQPERVVLDVVVDMAEIPTFQARRGIDADGDDLVGEQEASGYATSACDDAARRIDVAVRGRRIAVQRTAAEVAFPPGTAGLATLRLTCALTGDTGPLSADADLVVRNNNYDDRVGWREMAAVGDGTTLLATDVGSRSISRRLASYPDDLLLSPPDQHSASLRARPGGPAAPEQFSPGAQERGSAPRGVDGATRYFTERLGREELTPVFGLVAVSLSMLLGALHALAPGHGKTVMAAYLVGQRGSARQAALIGLTVTATHTTGVLILGVVLSTVTTLAPESTYPWLGLASGALVTAIGVGLLRSALRRRSSHSHRHLLAVGAGDPHGHQPGHGHSHPHPHPHDDGQVVPGGVSRRGLVAVGLAGGLVPSPSALIVLLGAIALGRAWFGVVLVVGYGAGMAAVLTGAGLLLVRVRAALDRRASTGARGRIARVSRALPVVTAALVLGAGALLSVRALAQL